MSQKPLRVGFVRRFGLKTGIDFDHFGHFGIGYGLRRNYGCMSMCPSFQFQMYKKESVICELKKSFCCGLIL